MYIDKLDGRIDATFYDRMSTPWREEQTRCLREIERHQAANKSYMDEELGFSNLHGTRSASSKSRNPEKSGGFSIAWFRTARGRAVS
jgi:site-specific DNA recombinase